MYIERETTERIWRAGHLVLQVGEGDEDLSVPNILMIILLDETQPEKIKISLYPTWPKYDNIRQPQRRVRSKGPATPHCLSPSSLPSPSAFLTPKIKN